MTCDLGKLQKDLEAAERQLKSANTVALNTYNKYMNARYAQKRARELLDVTQDLLRVSVDNMTTKV